ncbi:MAG: acyl carrier protein [Lachnospiraceae bacterium]|nr:acyl carrier protein [Lachnospiraceae bacterium]
MEFDALRKVIAAVLGMDTDEIEPEMDFASDLGADSLDLCQIFMGVEDELGVKMPSEGIERITTVREAVEYIKQSM